MRRHHQPSPDTGGTNAIYELGGMAMIDLEFRNPFKMTADGNHLTVKVAPDNGEEGNGTEIIAYEATVTPPK